MLQPAIFIIKKTIKIKYKNLNAHLFLIKIAGNEILKYPNITIRVRNISFGM